MRSLRAFAVTVLCFIATAASAHAQVTPQSANGFYNSVGIDTHLTFANSTYGQWPRLVGLLDQLGVKHLGDGGYGNPDPSWAWFNNFFETNVELAVSNGMKFAFQMGEPGYTGGTIPQLITEMSGPLRNSIEALEDPNEFDTSSGLADWQDPLASYDQQLYSAAKANPSLASLPVIGPSLVNQNSPTVLGSESGEMDDGGIHPYTGGNSPTPAYTQAQLQRISAVSGGDPVWATEAGYSTALGAPAVDQPVNPYVGAVYTLRELLENYSAGIARTYLYELIDDAADASNTTWEDHYGLLNADYSPKPAFTALLNLLALVGQGAPAQLTPVGVTVTSGPSDLRQLVLQQSTGRYLEILWRTSSIWDVTTRAQIALPTANVAIQIPAGDTASSADPVLTGQLAALGVSQNQISVPLGADPVVVQITAPAVAAPAPTVLTSTTSGAANSTGPTTGVSGHATVYAVFSEAMDEPSTAAAFSFTDDTTGQSVPGSISWYGNTVPVFTPSAGYLAPGDTFTATISTAAKASDGTPLASPVSWSFTVAANPVVKVTPPATGADLRVAVPRVTGLAVDAAYARLHAAGLRVSLPAVVLDYVVSPPSEVVRQSVPAGRHVERETNVRLGLGCPGCAAGSPALPVHMPRYHVPSLVGRSVAAAYRWTEHRTLYFVARLGPLHGGNAPTLFQNYRVTRQRPRHARTIQLGDGRTCCRGSRGSFLPTPLTVWGSAIPKP
jgi:hypothetical protein